MGGVSDFSSSGRDGSSGVSIIGSGGDDNG